MKRYAPLMRTKSPFAQFSFTVAALSLVLFCGRVVADEKAPKADASPQPLPAKIDLRPRFEQWGLEPRQQGKRSTCSVLTFTGALEFAVANQRQQGERLSVEYLNWAANQTRRNVRDGGFFSEMWNGFSRYGICAEKLMPYEAVFDSIHSPSPTTQAEAKEKLALGLQLHWIKQWNVKTGLGQDEFAAIKKTLRQGWPVCGGFRWPKQEKWQQDVLQMCPPEEVFDGHSVLLVGYRDDAGQPGDGVLIFRNTSHGGRDGYMPYTYAQAYMNDALWIEAKKR